MLNITTNHAITYTNAWVQFLFTSSEVAEDERIIVANECGFWYVSGSE